MTAHAPGRDRSRRLIDWLAHYRHAVVIVWLAAAVGLGLGAFKLGFEQDSRVYFSRDNPERLALETLERRHGRYGAAILMLVPGDGTVFSVTALQAVAESTRRAEEITGVASVRSLATHVPQTASTPFALPGPLIPEGATVTPAHVERALNEWRAGPEALRPLVSEAGDVAGVVILIPATDDGYIDAARAVGALKTELAAAHPGIEYRLSGDAVMEVTFLRAIVQDILGLVPLQALAIVLLLLVMLQCLWSTLALLAVLAAAIAMTMGVAGWAGLDLNGVTSGAPMILLGLAVAACIHILIVWQQALRHTGDRAEALVETVRLNAFPVFLAIVSTVASFLCLNFSDSPPFRELGNLVALGLSLTFLLAFSLLPALVLMLPGRPALGRVRLETAMAGLGGWVIRARAGLLVLLFIVVAGSAWGATRLSFDDRFAHYFSERFEFRRDTDFMEQRLTGLTVLDFSLPAAEFGGVADPGYLRRVDRFAAWLAEQPEVERVSSFAAIARRIAGLMPVATGADGLPADEAAGKTVLSTYRSFRPADAVPGRPITEDGEHSVVSVVLSGVGSRQIRDFAERGDRWLRDNAPGIAAPAAGMALLAAHLSERNTPGMAVGTVAALAMVSLILLAALRSLRLGLVSLIPNLVPMLFAYGVWGASFGEVTFAATVVMAMTFGIIVDDTVHFLAKYNRLRRRSGLSVTDAIPESFRTVGIALAATSIAISTGFLALSFSGFVVNRHLGLLTLLVLLSALAAVLLFLPPLLTLFDRRRT